MDITAVLLDYPPSRWIGSELATHAALRYLQQRGHRVTVSSYSAAEEYSYQSIRVVPRAVPIIGTDLIITHSYTSPVLLAPVKELQQRFLGRSGRVRIPLVVMAHNSRNATLQAIAQLEPDLVVPNALATAGGLGAWASEEDVVRPPLKLPRSRAALISAVSEAHERPRMAGYVNSAAIKGGAALAELAGRGVGRGYGLLGVAGGYGEQLAPVQYSAQLTPREMTERYFGTIRVHLQPSSEESWGMTALEALAQGCGVVATALPGPVEALSEVPPRWVRWLAPGEAGADDIHRAVLEMIDRPAPTSTEARELADVLWQKAFQARTDRKRFEKTARTLVERNRLLV